MKIFIEPQKNIPLAGSYDVLVAGGGIAGVASALAAARNGKRTVIIEKQGGLGGLATLGLVAIYLPLCDGMGNLLSAGIAEELFKESIRGGTGEVPAPWRDKRSVEEKSKIRYKTRFNPSVFMMNLDEILLKAGVELLFDTRICAIHRPSKVLEAVFVENKDGRSAYEASVFVDCTGDGDILNLCGEPTKVLGDNRRTWWFYSTDKEAPYQLQLLNDPLTGPCPEGSRFYDGVLAKDISAFLIDGRKKTREQLEIFRKKSPGLMPAMLPCIPQFRMTRRLHKPGEISEVFDHKNIASSIGMAGDWRTPGPAFHIPYEALTAEHTSNLLTAGRSIAVSDGLWDVTRAIPACAVSGEAAGTAAALFVEGGYGSLGDLPIEALQAKLRGNGVIIKDFI